MCGVAGWGTWVCEAGAMQKASTLISPLSLSLCSLDLWLVRAPSSLTGTLSSPRQVFIARLPLSCRTFLFFAFQRGTSYLDLASSGAAHGL